MSTLWSKCLVFATALLVALPPGWCCAKQVVKPEKAPAKAKHCCCCPESSPKPQSGTNRLPPDFFKNCCCQKDTTAPQNPESPALDLSPAISLVIDNSGKHAIHTAVLLDAASFSSPPLHILQCLWRC